MTGEGTACLDTVRTTGQVAVSSLVAGLYEAARIEAQQAGALVAARRAAWHELERVRARLEQLTHAHELPWWQPDVTPELWGAVRQAAQRAAVPWLRRAYRAARCGRMVQVWLCESCQGETARPLHCSIRFCAHCASTRRQRAKRVVSRLVERMQHAPVHVVLTIPSTERLADGVRRLGRAWGSMRRTSWWRGIVRGGVVAWEITRTHAGWHPHLHVLADARWIPWGELVSHWQRATGCTCRRPRGRRVEGHRAIGRVCCRTPDLGDGERHVDRCPGCACAGGSAQPHGVHVDRRPARRAVAELVKYVVKDIGGCKRSDGELELTTEDWAELVRVMWHRRALAAFGSLHDALEEPEMESPRCQWCEQQTLIWRGIEDEGYEPRAPPSSIDGDETDA